MRGLAFPPTQDADRETSYEYGTPFSNVDDIPIDPALVSTPIDPVFIMQEPMVTVEQHFQPESQVIEYKRAQIDDYDLFQYSGAAQGEEFTQHIPAPYLNITQEQQPPSPTKPKRKRKPRKEGLCSFCLGSAKKNNRGLPEILLTCHDCGRSGHPSCMQLERLSDVVQTYPWKCVECKICEVCQEKGDDARILFCDACDRGWHLDCMVPPLDAPPEGEWHCPECPPVVPEDMQVQEDQEEYYHVPEEEATDPAREASVASSSRSANVALQTKKGKKKKGSGGGGGTRARQRTSRAPVVEEDEEEEHIDIEETPTNHSRRGRPIRPPTAFAVNTTSSRRRSYGRARPPPTPDEEEEEELELEEEEIMSATPVRSHKRRRAPVYQEPSPPPAPLPRVRLRLPTQRGAKGKEREEDELPKELFEDFLLPEERDTSKTTVLNSDKVYFERSRFIAEQKLAPPQPTASSSSRTLENSEDYLSIRPRPLRSSTVQQSTPLTPLTLPVRGSRTNFSNSPGPSTPGGPLTPSTLIPKFEPGVLRIRSIRFGPYDIKTWYDAPFPEEYASIPDGRLWICEFCLKYMKSRFGATRHQMKCHARHPPGDEIYRDGGVSIFEVDGRRNKIYCQNLCLLSKMFLDHKSLFYDVEPFLFYVIAQVDEFGARFVGYFSKEKRCPKDYNLSCIMTLPVRQRQGWGNLLMDFSYLLSKIEQRLGSPEKPLSSLGALGYRNYWTLAVMRFLQTAPDNVRLEDICSATSLTHEDAFNTLTHLEMIYVGDSSPPMRPSPGQSIKFPRGRKNGVSRRHLQKVHPPHPLDIPSESHSGAPNSDFIPPKRYEIRFERDKVETYMQNWEAKGYLKLRPEKLQWTPYLTSRMPQDSNLPLLPVMDTTGTTSGGPSIHTPSEAQPTTPLPLIPLGLTDFGFSIDELEEQKSGKDELPMIVDKPSPEAKRSRQRNTLKPLTKDPPPTTRSTRSQRVLSPVSTPLSPSKSLRTRTSHVNALPQPDEPISTRSMRRNGTNNGVIPTPTRKPSNRKMDQNMSNDEAYAARLAMEEMQQGSRQLRSRRSDLLVENQRPGAIPVSPPSKPVRSRKRRRIDSSPDVEVAQAPPPVAVARDEEAEDDDLDAEGEMEEEEDQMAMDVDQTIKVNGDHRALETQTPEHTDATTVVENSTGDIKSEDASDDTVFYPSAKHAESDLRSTLDLEDCHDEDADGEFELEEDAEGELDLELYNA